MTRRRFLDWSLGTSLGAMCVSIVYLVLRYLVPPRQVEAQTKRTVAARDGELKPIEAKVFAFGSEPAILIRTADGGYKAFAATCTHLSCTVQFRGDLRQIWCACHNGFYDLNGQNVAGPPPRPLGKDMAEAVARLRSRLGEARTLLDRAQRAGMEVSADRFAL